MTFLSLVAMLLLAVGVGHIVYHAVRRKETILGEMIDGTVTGSAPYNVDAGGGDRDSGIPLMGPGSHRVFVHYRYTVNGETHRGVDWLGPFETAEKAEMVLGRMRDAAKIRVLVSAEDPSQSTLYTPPNVYIPIFCIGIAVLLAISAIL
jgi:hypothetical protein